MNALTNHFKFPGFVLMAAALFCLQCAQENILTENDGAIKIDSISPSSGFTGTQVRIYGKGFALVSGNNKVFFNGLAAEVGEQSSIGTLLVTVPLQATTGPVSLTIGNSTVQGPIFTVQEPPVVTGIDPARGYVGDQVRINGNNLALVESIAFNGVNAEIIMKTQTQITVTAPASTTGTITLHYGIGTITGPIFTYIPLPEIQNINVIDGRLSYLHIFALHVKDYPQTIKFYLNDEETAILAQQLTPEPSQFLIYTPATDGPNPSQIVIEANGKQSAPYELTMQPWLSDYTNEQQSVNGNNITFKFILYGEYFGNAGTNRSVNFRVAGTTQSTPAQISSWTPTLIECLVTLNPSTLGPNDFYEIIVVVNGVESNVQGFRP